MDIQQAYEFSKRDPTVPLFTQAQVMPVLSYSCRNIKAVTLQNWVNRGLVRLSDNNPGRAVRRMYSLSDMVKLHLMAKLSALGVSASEAASLSSQLNDAVDEFIKAEIEIEKRLRVGDAEADIGTSAGLFIYSIDDRTDVELVSGSVEVLGKKADVALKQVLRVKLSHFMTKSYDDNDVALMTEQFGKQYVQPDNSVPDNYIFISLSASFYAVKNGILLHGIADLKKEEGSEE